MKGRPTKKSKEMMEEKKRANKSKENRTNTTQWREEGKRSGLNEKTRTGKKNRKTTGIETKREKERHDGEEIIKKGKRINERKGREKWKGEQNSIKCSKKERLLYLIFIFPVRSARRFFGYNNVEVLFIGK